MTGELDKVIDNRLCEEYLNLCTSLKSGQKEYEHFLGMGHELHRDVNHHLVVNRAMTFFAKRLSTKSPGAY
jgi:alpha-beta hydrolase superfamily lysophospholipase